MWILRICSGFITRQSSDEYISIDEAGAIASLASVGSDKVGVNGTLGLLCCSVVLLREWLPMNFIVGINSSDL